MTADSAPRLDSLEPAPLAARRSSARAVAADLEAIFGSAPPADLARPAARRLQPATARADGPASGAWLATVGTLASAAFLGLAAAAFVITRGPEPRPARPRPPVPIEFAQRAPIPSPGPLDPLGGARVPPGAAVMTTAVTPAPARPTRPRPTIRRVRSQGACCAADVTQADRRLRQAWASAVRAGVPRPVMVSYRDRWEGLRLSRAHQPRRLVAGYGALARDLDRAAARSHGAGAPRRYAQRSWRSRYAPWWS